MSPDAPQSRRAETEPPRKRPRLGIIIRVLIYVPLLGFFGWQAAQKFIDARRIADDNFRTSVQQWLQHPPRTIVMPNGEVMPVFEMTEQEAVEMGLIDKPDKPDKPDEPAADSEGETEGAGKQPAEANQP